jgi:hypothetical protein
MTVARVTKITAASPNSFDDAVHGGDRARRQDIARNYRLSRDRAESYGCRLKSITILGHHGSNLRPRRVAEIDQKPLGQMLPRRGPSRMSAHADQSSFGFGEAG